MVLGGTHFLALILPGYLTYCIRHRREILQDSGNVRQLCSMIQNVL